MIHYAILPVYTPVDDEVAYVELEYDGHSVLACQTENGYILERIYSTDPKDYVVEGLMPGSRLKDNLINKIIQ